MYVYMKMYSDQKGFQLESHVDHTLTKKGVKKVCSAVNICNYA